MKRPPVRFVLLVSWLCAGAPGSAAPDADSANAPQFREGDVLDQEDIGVLRPFLPPEFWAHRDFFFYEGMQLEIGPPFRDYAPPAVYRDATEQFSDRARLGPQSSLVGYVAGQPFPMDAIDCAADPEAGARIAWNFDYRWSGHGATARFYYSYWDRGEKLPLYFEGHSEAVSLSHRPEPEYHASGAAGDVFRNERRKEARYTEVEAPFDARGTALLNYRYKASDLKSAHSRNDDLWVYVPQLRRVRRLSTARRTDAVSGTDFTFDDLFSFSGIVPQYEWECLGTLDLIAPMNSRAPGFPYQRDLNFGPYGLSYADDRWELRHAVKIRFVPRDPSHPYGHKDLYLDVETLAPLYSAAYDRKGELWKLIWHNHRWSDDAGFGEYRGWSSVPEPRDLTVVSDTIVNVQTGTGNRIEFYDRHGTPHQSRGRMRRAIDQGRLTNGR